MRVNKTQAVLYMYETLLEKGVLIKEDTLSELEIPNLTFLRYIQELRAYLLNFDSQYELVYKRETGSYKLLKEVL